MKVRDLMAKNPYTVERNDVLSLPSELVERKRIRHFPVLEDGRLVGILSQTDLLHAAFSSAMGYGERASEEYLRTIPVKEVMIEEVVTASGDEDVSAAARRMLEHKIGCLPVVEDGRLIGILSETDLLRLVAEGSK